MSDRDVFNAALERTDPAARAAYLDEACGSDHDFRARIELLLRTHEEPDSPLDLPAGPPDDATTGTLDAGARYRAEGSLGFLAPPGRPDSFGRIGHYDVLEVLGRGGFGVVFRAFDDVLKRVVAVKMLASHLAVTSPARKRFLREARSSAAVRHENVVQVYAVEEQPLPYLVMEFIPGETLEARLKRLGPLGVAEVVRVGRQIADGLAAAHAQGLVHRDVKPANVLIEAGPPERVKLTDFGLARAADDASLSQSGVVAGTPLYMSPEQARGESLDHRTDLFSLGSVLYVLTSGRPPFRATGTVAVLKRVIEDTPRPIQELIPETPDWLCRIIDKLHAKDPADRFGSAREVADLLADCERQPVAHAGLKDLSRIPRGKPTPPGPALRRWAAVGATVVGLALLVGAATVVARSGRPTAGRPAASNDAAAPPSAGEAPARPKSRQEAWANAFTQYVAALPAEDRVAAVEAELKRGHPGREIVVRGTVENGQVTGLWIDRPVDDVAPLAALRHLQYVTFMGGPRDFTPLRGLPLRKLDCYNQPASDLSPLAGMPLENLMLWSWAGNDLTPLRGMKLKSLNCGGAGAKPDLAVLQGMPLTHLWLNHSGVTDLKPLAGLKLKVLGLTATRVSDLSPLRGMPLEELNCANTAVTDFRPLAGLPLKKLDLDFIAERDARILRGIRTLEAINQRPAAEFLQQAGEK